jgi:hypothetical protein
VAVLVVSALPVDAGSVIGPEADVFHVLNDDLALP